MKKMYLYLVVNNCKRRRPKPSRETKFSGANGDRGKFIFPVQLTMSRIGNFTRLTHTLLKVLTIHTNIRPFFMGDRNNCKNKKLNFLWRNFL